MDGSRSTRAARMRHGEFALVFCALLLGCGSLTTPDGSGVPVRGGEVATPPSREPPSEEPGPGAAASEDAPAPEALPPPELGVGKEAGSGPASTRVEPGPMPRDDDEDPDR